MRANSQRSNHCLASTTLAGTALALVMFAAASVATAQTTPAAPAATSPTATPPTPGTATPGTATPGTATPGTATPGTATPGTATPGTATPAGAPAADAIDPTKVAPEQMPDSLRIRRLEQRVAALKERAWRSKARIGMLKESVLGGGVGSQALVTHNNDMGSSFRLVKLVYSLDGTQVFARTDEAAENLYKTKKFEIYAGPITPGSHALSVLAVYRGNGYGVFKYLNKYTFQVRSSHTFNALEGRATKVDASGFEKGGATTPLEQRPSIEFKVTQIAPEKSATYPKPAAGAAATPAPAPAAEGAQPSAGK